MLDRFLAYARDFERAYTSRDWRLLEPHFTSDASYEVTGGPPRVSPHRKGRDDVIRFFEWMIDNFDRKFAERRLVLMEKPLEEKGLVQVHGAAIYRLSSGERCHVLLHSTAHFRDGRIHRLVDQLTPGTVHELSLFLAQYPELFPPSLQGPEHWEPRRS